MGMGMGMGMGPDEWRATRAGTVRNLQWNSGPVATKKLPGVPPGVSGTGGRAVGAVSTVARVRARGEVRTVTARRFREFVDRCRRGGIAPTKIRLIESSIRAAQSRAGANPDMASVRVSGFTALDWRKFDMTKKKRDVL